MSNEKRNYLRTYRRRLGLSQADVAFLLGLKDGSQVSRFEREVRTPNLKLVFALERLFAVPAEELFRGIYREVYRQTTERLLALSDELSRHPSTPENIRKVEIIRSINLTGSGGAYGG